MKRLILIGITLLPCIYGYNQCADPANIYKFEFNGKKYEVVKEELSWADAVACSKERGGYLLEINDQHEQAAIFDELLNNASISTSYLENFVWIGATDKAEEGTWIWDGNNDGEGQHFWSGQGANGEGTWAVVDNAYVNWGGNLNGLFQEPDNSGGMGQNCATIGLAGWPEGATTLGSPGEWNDHLETVPLYYIVEYDSLSTGFSPLDAQEIILYPNPANEVLYVDGKDLIKIEIFDVAGRRTGTYLTSPVDLSQYQSGFYFLKISTLSHTLTKKFYRE